MTLHYDPYRLLLECPFGHDLTLRSPTFSFGPFPKVYRTMHARKNCCTWMTLPVVLVLVFGVGFGGVSLYLAIAEALAVPHVVR